MLKLLKSEYKEAARVCADGFLSDPAFALLLQGEKDPKALLYQYFLNYFEECKELLLYKYIEQGQGYMCIYHWDTVFADFEIPSILTGVSRFQILEQYYQRDYAVLDILAVEKNSRGQGIAGKLIDGFVAHCQAHHLTPLVEIFNEKSLPLYIAHGFGVSHKQMTDGITTFILEYK